VLELSVAAPDDAVTPSASSAKTADNVLELSVAGSDGTLDEDCPQCAGAVCRCA
jgi:hypothetical protein